MKMNKKIMATFVVLMFALSIAGFVYAHWSDYVYIEGTVKMGDLIVGWEEIIMCWDNEPDLPIPKDIGDVECDLELPEDSVHHEPPCTVFHKLVVTVTDAYPQYEATCKVTIKNAGTIPAHIINIIMTPGAGLVISSTWDDVNGNPIGWELDDATTGDPVLNIELTKQLTGLSLVCNQLDPCTPEEVDLWLEIKQDGAEPCHTYTFSMEIEAIQWNKA